MQDKIKIDDSVMKALHVNEVRRLICDTDKGKLNLVIRKGETKYFLTLDAVPLDKETNKELMELLFPIKIAPLKVNMNKEIDYEAIPDIAKAIMANELKPKNKGGRPKGSNKKVNGKAH